MNKFAIIGILVWLIAGILCTLLKSFNILTMWVMIGLICYLIFVNNKLEDKIVELEEELIKLY